MVEKKQLLRQFALELKNKIEEQEIALIIKVAKEVTEGTDIDPKEIILGLNENIVRSEPIKVDNIQKSKNAFEKDKLPNFIPSEAYQPEGFTDNCKNLISNFKFALCNHSSSIQSFFNDLNLIGISDNIFSINDEFLNLLLSTKQSIVKSLEKCTDFLLLN